VERTFFVLRKLPWFQIFFTLKNLYRTTKNSPCSNEPEAVEFSKSNVLKYLFE